MIYQVKDNKKIPLGTQFDNSWEIEYDRDLSSQIIDKSEWTATEDCWFQWLYTWLGPNEADPINRVNAMQVTLNGTPIQVKAGYTSRTALEGSSIILSAIALLKKGDVVAINETLEKGVFKDSTVRCFPIHRILSKDEESRDRTYFYRSTGTSEWTPYDCVFTADKPQGYVNIVMIKNNSQVVNVIWNVANATANYTGLGYADSVTTGLSDSKFPGKPYLNLRVAFAVGDTKTYFVTTNDCIIENIERR